MLDLNLNSHFALNPTNIDISRSTFRRTHNYKSSFNMGDLIPIYVDTDILPGDSFSIDSSKLIRTQPLVAPLMDNLVADFFWFAVPWRLVWNHTKEFFGENTAGAWTPEVEYQIPQIKTPEGGWNPGTIADYMGLPTKVDLGDETVSALAFRAYAMVCNEFFRSEVVSDPLNIPINDTTQTGSNGNDYINDVVNGGAPFVVARNFDFFSGALPSPQKGEAVAINLAGLSGSIPVLGNGKVLGLTNGTATYGLSADGGDDTAYSSNAYGKSLPSSSNTITTLSQGTGVGVVTKALAGENLENSGLIGDLTGVRGESLITINELRQAFQVQKYFEKLGRGGSRYREYIRSMFGVTSPDQRMQVPEYLGGNRFEININSIYQTSETAGTPQGNVAGYSVTSDSHHDFTFSFTEHCVLLGLMCVRRKASYQQGIERMWSRKTVLDLYNPLFANLGEMPIYNRQIYAQGSSVINSDTGKAYDDEVFGYQEAWAEYRYKPNLITGELRSNHPTSLDFWHLADYYSELPHLSDEWIREDKNVLDRALAVSSAVSNQFICDIYFDVQARRPMPVYSIPGLIDHH